MQQGRSTAQRQRQRQRHSVGVERSLLSKLIQLVWCAVVSFFSLPRRWLKKSSASVSVQKTGRRDHSASETTSSQSATLSHGQRSLVRGRKRGSLLHSVSYGPSAVFTPESSTLLSGYRPYKGNDLVAVGLMTLTGHLVVSVGKDGGILKDPVVSFYAPRQSHHALVQAVRSMMGVTCSLKSRDLSLTALGFEVMTCRPFQDKSLSYDAFINLVTAVGWPDTTGGNVLVRPCCSRLERLQILQRTLVLSMTRVLVIVISQLDRKQLKSVCQIINQAQTKTDSETTILIFHVNCLSQEVKKQTELIEGCFPDRQAAAVHQLSDKSLSQDYLQVNICQGSRSGVYHCYCKSRKFPNLMEILKKCGLSYESLVQSMSTTGDTVHSLVTQIAKQVGLRVIEKSLETGYDLTITGSTDKGSFIDVD